MIDIDSTPAAAVGGGLPLRTWAAGRDLLLRAGVGLLTIFVGVTAAFFVDGYRDQLEQAQQLRDTRLGIITELQHYEARGGQIADDIDQSIARWKAADAAGKQAVPGYYMMTGAPRPPTAAWTTAVASGVASYFDPKTQLELGYFYSEYTGIHDNYLRRLVFTEQEIRRGGQRTLAFETLISSAPFLPFLSFPAQTDEEEETWPSRQKSSTCW